MSKLRMCGFTICLFLGLSFLAVPRADAQDVKYTTVTEVKMGGGQVVGFLSRLAGLNEKSTETTYLKDTRMRTDDGDGSVIVDMSAFEWIMLDHNDRTYMRLSLDGMREMAEMAAREVEDVQMELTEEEQEALEEIEMAVRFDVDVRRTGERRDIKGMNAERVLLIMQGEATEAAFEEEEEDRPEGFMVIVTEMWNSRDVPGYEHVEAFYQRAGADMAGTASELAASFEGLQQAFAADPQMKEGLEQAGHEMAQVEGMTVRSTTHLAIVPTDAEFDPEDLFREREEGPGVADGARRAIGGAIGRRLGRGRQQEEPAEEERTPSVMTLMTVTTELQDISTQPLDAALFEIPEGYTERQLPRME